MLAGPKPQNLIMEKYEKIEDSFYKSWCYFVCIVRTRVESRFDASFLVINLGQLGRILWHESHNILNSKTSFFGLSPPAKLCTYVITDHFYFWCDSVSSITYISGRANWTDEIPPQAPNREVSLEIHFKSGVDGEWSDTTMLMTEFLRPFHKVSLCQG